jgi:hypothetical protein
MSRESNGDVMLLVRLRLDADVPKDVKLGMAAAPAAAERSVAARWAAASGKWRPWVCHSSASSRRART